MILKVFQEKKYFFMNLEESFLELSLEGRKKLFFLSSDE
jgi:hypothetical protein